MNRDCQCLSAYCCHGYGHMHLNNGTFPGSSQTSKLTHSLLVVYRLLRWDIHVQTPAAASMPEAPGFALVLGNWSQSGRFPADE